jgi:hypothetical protein
LPASFAQKPVLSTEALIGATGNGLTVMPTLDVLSGQTVFKVE